MKTNILLFSFLLLLLSCNEEIPQLKQKVYFEKHYINMAWLPQSSGFLIDSLGNVMEFRWVEVSHIWYDPDSTGYVSSANMNKNISFCQTDTFHINPDTLKYYVDRIQAASTGIISDPKLVMADAGTTTYSAFIFDSKTNLYKQVLLMIDGDISRTNSTPEANEIYRWLSRVGK